MARSSLVEMPVRKGQVIVIGFVGPSGVGKTTLVERLIPELVRRGLAVGAVKHSAHGFLADRPGKDSFRLYESGADAVALISQEQIATFRRSERGAGKDVSLAAALATLPQDLDVVLAEGFSWELVPRVLLLRAGEEAVPAHVAGGEVIEVVRVPNPPRGERPVFPDSLIELLTRVVESRVRAARGFLRGGGASGRTGAAPDS